MKYVQPCEICGTPVQRKPSRANKPFRCSLACSNKARSLESQVTNHCCWCKIEFRTSPKKARKYCTDACARLGRNLRQGVTCPICGKTVQRPPSQLDQQFCSMKCQKKSLQKRMAFICERCGKEVICLPKIAKVSRFCSTDCYQKYRGESGPERAIRLALNNLGILFIPQHPLGRFSVDFYLPLLCTGIEVDGLYWHQRPYQMAVDRRKDEAMRAAGITPLRITDKEIRAASDLTQFLAQKLHIGFNRRKHR